MRRLDHSMIFVLIAGTYTPFALLALRRPAGDGDPDRRLGGRARRASCSSSSGSTRRSGCSALVYVALGWVGGGRFRRSAADGSGSAPRRWSRAAACSTRPARSSTRAAPGPGAAVFGYHEIFHALVIAAARAALRRDRALRAASQLMEIFRTPDERFDDLPGFDFEPHYAEVDGLRLHHLDEGSGPTGRLLPRRADLGVPLPQDARPPLVAGGPPRRLPRLRRLRPLGQAHRPRLVHATTATSSRSRACSTALDLEDATVVVQDWGGPIGLRWAVENPDRVGAARDPQHRASSPAG